MLYLLGPCCNPLAAISAASRIKAFAGVAGLTIAPKEGDLALTAAERGWVARQHERLAGLGQRERLSAFAATLQIVGKLEGVRPDSRFGVTPSGPTGGCRRCRPAWGRAASRPWASTAPRSWPWPAAPMM